MRNFESPQDAYQFAKAVGYDCDETLFNELSSEYTLNFSESELRDVLVEMQFFGDESPFIEEHKLVAWMNEKFSLRELPLSHEAIDYSEILRTYYCEFGDHEDWSGVISLYAEYGHLIKDWIGKQFTAEFGGGPTIFTVPRGEIYTAYFEGKYLHILIDLEEYFRLDDAVDIEYFGDTISSDYVITIRIEKGDCDYEHTHIQLSETNIEADFGTWGWYINLHQTEADDPSNESDSVSVKPLCIACGFVLSEKHVGPCPICGTQQQ